MWVDGEYRVNRFHSNSENIFQVLTNVISEDTTITWISVPGSFTEEIPSVVPEIQFIARITNDGDQLFQFGDSYFLEKGFMGDEALFSIFSFPIVEGDPQHPLPNSSSVAISQTLSRKLFNDEPPIGKQVKVGRYDLLVSSVFADIPDHSTLKFQFILPFEIHKSYIKPTWLSYSYQTFVKLYEPTHRESATLKINEYRASLATTPEMEDDIDFYLQPFTDRYLKSEFENGLPSGGKIVFIRIFVVIGIFILLVACINFINLATARATLRAKEIGVRKASGSTRAALIVQFLTEAFVNVFIAILMSMAAAYFLVPALNKSFGLSFNLDLADPGIYLILIAASLIVTLLSGLYPAFVLSSFRVVEVMKRETGSVKGGNLRNALVVSQLSITIILSVCAVFTFRQLQFIHTKDMGYNRQDIITFVGTRQLMNAYENFRNDALSNPIILSVTRGNQNLYEIQGQVLGSLTWAGKTEDDDDYFRGIMVDMDFFETMDIKILLGRSFSRDYNDSNSFVLTKKAVETMRMTDPLGQRVSMWGIEGTVVGVAHDFHSRSLHEKINPVVFLSSTVWPRKFYMKIQHGKTQEAIQFLQTLLKKYNPEYPVDYSILEDEFASLYGDEKIINQLAISFTVIAVVLSCIGLYSLAAYSVENRRKEIGIRKVMGASVKGIIIMVCSNFVLLSIISIIIGSPLAYYLSQYFLESFEFRISLDWKVFMFCSLGLIAVMLLTIIYKVIRAALTNPIQVLRSE
ncbi:MAG: FtsX-like permease family protein [Flammeovirgaceae bacterium]|nr:FtsX-like permease family protein [Flammeovirgaceae bacterium]